MIVDLTHVDTRPGAPGNNPFTPPKDFVGDDAAYAHLIRERSANELDRGQHILCMIRRNAVGGLRLDVSGPYAHQAREIIQTMTLNYKQWSDKRHSQSA